MTLSEKLNFKIALVPYILSSKSTNKVTLKPQNSLIAPKRNISYLNKRYTTPIYILKAYTYFYVHFLMKDIIHQVGYMYHSNFDGKKLRIKKNTLKVLHNMMNFLAQKCIATYFYKLTY